MDSHTPLTLYPNPALRALSCVVHLLGVSILTHCISRRFSSDLCPTWRSALSHWPRLCVVLAFADSWLFVFSAGLVLFGIGLQSNSRVCAAAIDLCIVFYGTSKVMIYAFLTEKVYVVWSGGKNRLQTPAYMMSTIAVCLYVVPVLLMIVGRISMFREGDGACVIGISHVSSIGILTYDLLISIVLTALFLWPLLRSHILNPRLRRVAFRTMIAAFVSLTMSTINVAVVTILHGKEFGWLCLGSCSLDVISNAMALFWVTDATTEHSGETTTSHRDQRFNSHAVMMQMQAQTLPATATIVGDNPPGLMKSAAREAQGLQITVKTEMDVDGDNDELYKKSFPGSPHSITAL